HTKNIYKLDEVQTIGKEGATQKVGLSMFPMGPALKLEYPEVKNFTRINWHDKYQMTYKNERLFLPEAFAVDSTFFQIFDFKLISGDKNTALKNPHSILLTQKTARKLFGNADPIGKTVTHYGD